MVPRSGLRSRKSTWNGLSLCGPLGERFRPIEAAGELHDGKEGEDGADCDRKAGEALPEEARRE